MTIWSVGLEGMRGYRVMIEANIRIVSVTGT